MAKWKLGLISLARRVISAKPAKKRGRRKPATAVDSVEPTLKWRVSGGEKVVAGAISEERGMTPTKPA